MKILVTGSKGFIGKNLIAELENQGYENIYQYDTNSSTADLEIMLSDCDFVYHLAGVNRPRHDNEYMVGNAKFTGKILNTLIKKHNVCPVMYASSVQAELDNPYGLSKKAGENMIYDYNRRTEAKVFVYRFPNVYGKWCKPQYNSAIATFCFNIARDLPIQVNDPFTKLNLLYIDDVVKELINALQGEENRKGKLCVVPNTHSIRLGEIADLIKSFKKTRELNTVPVMSSSISKNLYSTYLSYLPKDQFSYDLKMNKDIRGSFTEFIRTPEYGQVSVNISKPGVTKGNHWHHTKNEKFLVVSGTGLIRFRRIDNKEIIEYLVSGEKLEVVDIPPGYTHNIQNIGDTDMVTIMWANEVFDLVNPDTYALEV